MKKEERESFIRWLIPTRLTLALFGFYVVLIGLFLYLLDKVTSAGFGIKEIGFTLVAAFLLTAVLAWITITMRKNPYLGLIIGLVIMVLLTNALFIRYKGPYTLTFAAIGALGTVGYLIYSFFLARKEEGRNG